MPYLFYRLGSADWPNLQPELIRLVSFVLLSVMIACSLGITVVLTWGGLALLLWNFFRARRDIYKVVTSARRLDYHGRQTGLAGQAFTAASPYPPSEKLHGSK